jgi:hypothetical protein
MTRLRSPAALAAILACLTLGLGPQQASADATQLCRSFTAVLLAPGDIIAAPYIAYSDIRTNMADYDDSRGVKIAYTVPGYAFLNFVQVWGTGIRIVAGALEFLPGLFTLFREGSPSAFFQNWEEGEALYSEDWGPCPIRVGSSYTSGG